MKHAPSPRAGRPAAPKLAARWHQPSPGRFVSALAPSGDRRTYPAAEGQTS
jgi:hypothetical protein